MLPGNEPFYELSLKLWEGLEQDFNYNAMISQRGIINLFHVMVKEMRMQEEEMQCCSKEQMLSFLMKKV